MLLLMRAECEATPAAVEGEAEQPQSASRAVQSSDILHQTLAAVLQHSLRLCGLWLLPPLRRLRLIFPPSFSRRFPV
jgi:hypothetical protein